MFLVVLLSPSLQAAPRARVCPHPFVCAAPPGSTVPSGTSIAFQKGALLALAVSAEAVLPRQVKNILVAFEDAGTGKELLHASSSTRARQSRVR